MRKLALLSLITSFFLGSMLFPQTPPQKTRILVGSPIRQKSPILHQFLESLKQLHQETCALDFFFIDDNDAEESHKMLQSFAKEKGVKFQRIKNITYWGEDRHFCIRALALGLTLHVDTHYPAYHIYRDSDLAGVDDFYSNIEQKS